MPITTWGAVPPIAGSRHITNAWQPCAGLAGPVRQVRTIINIIDRQDLRNSSGNFAMFAAIRRAPSLVSSLAADRALGIGSQDLPNSSGEPGDNHFFFLQK